MNDVARALQRKFGPLPAWAWAGIAGGALYFYRRSRSGAGPLGAANVPAALSPDTSDQTAGLQPPVTLQPGESVYDPNSQQLLGGSPADTGGGDTGGDTPAADAGVPASSGSKKKAKPKPKGKRSKKPKPKHHGKAAAPGHKIRRPRLPAVTRGRRAKPTGHPVRHTSAPKPRHVTPAAHAAAAPGRGRAAPPARVSLRQRPAAPHVVAQQRVQAHPAAAPKGAARAPVAPPAPRRPAPRPAARRRA